VPALAVGAIGIPVNAGDSFGANTDVSILESFVFSVEVKTLFVLPSYIKSALNLLELLIKFYLVVSLGCL